jgi:hypothetical protein
MASLRLAGGGIPAVLPQLGSAGSCLTVPPGPLPTRRRSPDDEQVVAGPARIATQSHLVLPPDLDESDPAPRWKVKVILPEPYGGP